jgi:hypothetical protein
MKPRRQILRNRETLLLDIDRGQLIYNLVNLVLRYGLIDQREEMPFPATPCGPPC